jgi:N-succinyl-L-ornithine transcarbamylase
MKQFTCVQDIGDLKSALAEAFEIKKNRFKFVELGRNKTLMMIFFNSSLRTRLSTQKAATNLGMNVIVLDINQGAWKLETERGVIMDGDKPEHLLEAIPVMGCYCDIIGIRSFARFESKEFDYQETILNQFIQYSGKPVFSMEAATRHPLQSFADLITIEEYKKTPDLFPILSGENSVECRPLLMLRKFISNHFERGLASFFVSRSIHKVRFPSSRMRKRNRD